MASISKEDGRNSWKLSWYDSNKRKKSFRLGAMPKKTAEQFRTKFEELEGIRRGGGSLPASLVEWVDTLEPDLRTKLEDSGLIEKRRQLTLGGFCEEFKASRKSVADATAVRDRQVCDLLIERFGAGRMLESITVRDAEDWQQWLASHANKRDSERKSLSSNTVRRRTGVARQIFATAIRWNLLRENPFRGLASTVRENKERQEFIPWESVAAVIKTAPTTEWKALIAFCRLVGPRVPSELVGLSWNDLDFENRRITLRSPKTAHHGGEHAMRSCPMFPELVPYLEALSESVGPGIDVPLSAPVFPMAVDPQVNLRTGLRRYIIKAGLSIWPKLFHNLRSSRETELLSIYPVADVCRWFGHSATVAARFYAQARSEIAEIAAREPTIAGSNECSQVGSKAGDKGTEVGSNAGDISSPQGCARNAQTRSKNQRKKPLSSDPDGSLRGSDKTVQWAKRDSTAPQILKESDGFQASGFYSGVHSDSIKRDLEELISVWIERHGLESLAEVLADLLEGWSLEQLSNALSRRAEDG
jgi:integrase